MLVLLLAPMLGGCEDRDPYMFNICRLALPGIEEAGTKLHLITQLPDTGPGSNITLHYHLIPSVTDDIPDTSQTHAITCFFASDAAPGARPALTGIETTRFGPVSTTHLALLTRFWLNRIGGEALASYDTQSLEAALPGYDIGLKAAYGLQLTLHGLSRGAVYGMMALAFTLIYGLIRRINLAFGELMMTGALATVLTSLFLSTTIGWLVPVIVGASGLMAMIYGGWISHITWRWVFAPLTERRVSGQAILVASLGCVLFLQELVRLAISSRNFNLPPVWHLSFPLLRGDHFVVRLHGFDLVTIGMAIIAAIGLVWLMKKTSFGRGWQAISQDRLAAALCGIRPQRIEAQTFILAGILCGLTGCLLALRYGVINFHSGTLFGFKALTAAILGGIGHLRGAWLGGILIGLLESLWTGYFGDPYRDVAVFGLLALVLMLRPAGLLGIDDRRDALLAARGDQ
ncbi:branched-chain amino acid ABC transporter permease [Thalassospira sp.]|uniref:branched-chain amino acid ABC transporter permease n=1 Tax=Thalassospira sp. TaxID=1912094 RepID=UPI0027361956|nr:branched-chain amino acid ABC transporter permease [Thalassospira sp.]MDP2698656.1 branched-chain amino acid ABC transporter permease [Thalassospira sp.]